ncbi:unnamed protein product [Lactuca saligna]|uniref:Uncharacterized protein n=1 Tax=Lactuca saligna TaxID=75948 RepID=A0AA36E1U0_LACSI|nr:unnamed protein product [Lactuca saligna]
MVKPSILLVLDEPTNYLDIPSKEMFEIVDNDVEEPNEYLSDIEEKRLVDDSGWSSRTKAVGNYLQNIFNKEEENRRKALRINNLLNGKTCKEASRMFFKTLGRVNMHFDSGAREMATILDTTLVQALLLTSQSTATGNS